MPDRLGRTPFVGRQRELASLLAALDATGHGQGRVALIAGEPGIGKTRLLSEFAQQARAEGWQVFAGRAYDSDGMPAYLPFSEALRDYVRALPLDHLRAQLDEAGPELALLAPDIRRRLPDLATPPPASPEEQRYRLFESVADFLLAVPRFAEARGLLLILDDLHWADPSTLLLMQHLVRRLTAGPLLLAGAYRGQEVGRDHPLAAVLADLRREEAVERIALAPLGAAEIGTLVRGLTGDEAAPVVVEAIERRTEGNPFFVGELVRELVAQEHDLGRPETVVAWPALPEGVREVIDRRLARLSGAAGRLLQVAAVLGSSFSATALRAAAGEEPAILLAALDEALAAGMVRESGDGYEFSHALIRQTLHDGLSLVRRQQLHLQVAEALEQQYAGRLGEYAAELAEHFSQSTEAAGLAKAVAYTEVAAQRASSVYAYGEAVRHREQALQWQVVLDPDDTARRCDLLLALGEALVYTGDPARRAEAAAEEAYTLADTIADHPRAVRAYQIAIAILGAQGAGTLQASNWDGRIEMHAEPETLGRVLADIRLGQALLREGRWADSWAYRQRALDLARRLADPETLFLTVYQFLASPVTPANAAEQYRVSEEFETKGVAGVSSRRAGVVLWSCRLSFFQHGERERWQGLARRIRELGERTPYPLFRLYAINDDLGIALVDGDLEGVVQATADLAVRSEELGNPAFGRSIAEWLLPQVCRYLGRYDEALSSLGAAGAPFHRAMRAAILAEIGRVEEGRAALQQFLERAAKGDELPYGPLAASVRFLEAAVALGEREAASTLFQALSAVGPLFIDTCVARHLGAAAAFLGDPEQAMRYYEQALEASAKFRHRPELALAHLGMAEVLLDAGDGSRVSGHGDGTGAGRGSRVAGHGDGAAGADAGRGSRVAGHGDGAAGADAGHGSRVSGHGDGAAGADAGHGSRVSGHGDGAAGAMGGAAGAMNRAPTDGDADGARAGETPALPDGAAPPPPDTRYPIPDTRVEALHHLDRAIPELRDMHMQPGLERALRLRERASAPVATAPHAPVYPDGLSPREVEMLRLIAAGRSNQAIADELVISVNTVLRHITNLFAKIGAANRTEAANYAHRLGLA